MKKFRNCRHRRTNKQVLRYGQKAKAKHSLKTGRTGQVHEKRQWSKKPLGLKIVVENLNPFCFNSFSVKTKLYCHEWGRL